MEKIMSKFNIKKKIRKGDSTFISKCRYCNAENEVTVTNKLNKQKITTYKCINCEKINQIGDIYNFDSKKKLNQRLDSRFNSVIYNKYEWSQDYDNI